MIVRYVLKPRLIEIMIFLKKIKNEIFFIQI